jgi:selT/selW/selH-like putative selenoprotein
VTGAVGAKTSFEIELNGVLIHSKLKTGSFPSDEEIVTACKKAGEA